MVNYLKQPLFHFLAIGALLFAIYYMVNPTMAKKDTIVLDDEQVSRIETLFEKEWGRKPRLEELSGLLDKHIQQEVYYRKALLMNLDHNDEIIRRRLDQKLRFVSNDLATMREPTDEELINFYNSNREKYHQPRRYSFSHIYFNPDKRKDPKKDALSILETLPATSENIEQMKGKGDSFPFSHRIENLSVTDMIKEMGTAFTESIQKIPLRQWQGPLLSGYGVHLVFIEDMHETSEAKFQDIRDVVLRDFQYKKQQDYNNELYKNFRNDFNIELNISESKYNKNLISQFLGLYDKK